MSREEIMLLYAERLAVCKRCPQYGKFFRRPHCKVCHCFLEIKGRLPGEQCPLGRWNR